MKNLNNKGFTLVEVLSVIAILAIIMVIAIPTISSSIERSNKKKDEALEKVIKSEAELYVSKYKASITYNECYIDVGDLIAENNLNENDIEGYKSGCLIYNNGSFDVYRDHSKCNGMNKCR